MIPCRAFLTALALICTGAAAGEVSVAVAANFTAPMQKIAAAFERDTGHKAVLSFGSTGRFYAQVKNGAPFQVLLAADDETPAKLEMEGLAIAGTRFTYATGRLVLWSARADVVDDKAEVLRKPGTQRLAVADPKLAPYGAAAMQTLAKMGLLSSWQSRLVQGESISQTHQFVATGNALVGFVALSQVMTDGRIEKGSAWIVPVAMHEPLRQDAVMLNAGRGNAAATALLQYLQGPSARALIRSHGYEF